MEAVNHLISNLEHTDLKEMELKFKTGRIQVCDKCSKLFINEDMNYCSNCNMHKTANLGDCGKYCYCLTNFILAHIKVK